MTRADSQTVRSALRAVALFSVLAAGACIEGKGYTLGPQDAVIEVFLDGVPAGAGVELQAYVYDPISTHRVTMPVAIGGSVRFENLGDGFDIEVGIEGLEEHHCTRLDGVVQQAVTARSDRKTDVRFRVGCRTATLRVNVIGIDPLRHLQSRIAFVDGTSIDASLHLGTQDVFAQPGLVTVTVDGFTDAQGLVWGSLSTSTDVPLTGMAEVTIAPRPDVISARIDPTVARIHVGETVHLEGYVTTSAAGEQQLQMTWSSADVGIATLVAGVSGQWADVTGVAPGTVTVRAEFYGRGATATIEVDASPVNTPPVPLIAMPANASVHSGASPVSFSGSAQDAEDGALAGNALQWTSSVDGAIGTGGQFARQLSPGAHTITLTATDADGASASTSVDITVTDPNPSGSISGRVTANGYAMSDVTVTLSGPVSAVVATDNNGAYAFTGLPAGTYAVSINSPYSGVTWPFTSATVNLAAGESKTLDFAGSY